MKKAKIFLSMIFLAVLFAGCFGAKTTAFLMGAGVGVGATCMYLWGNPFCSDGSHFNQNQARATTPLWQTYDPNFPDASVPYDMY